MQFTKIGLRLVNVQKIFVQAFLKPRQTLNSVAFNGCQQIRSVTPHWEEKEARQAYLISILIILLPMKTTIYRQKPKKISREVREESVEAN